MLRKNKEEMWIIVTENTNLKADLKSLSSMERALRQEIANMIKEREEKEETNQFINTKISHAAFELHKTKAENMMLVNKIEELMNENYSLKEAINHGETDHILMIRALENKEIEKKKMKEALDRAHYLLNANQSMHEYLEISDKRPENYIQTPSKNNYSNEYSPSKKRESTLEMLKSKFNPYASPIESYRIGSRSSSKIERTSFTSLRLY